MTRSLSADEHQLLERWLAEVVGAEFPAIAIFLAGDQPGRPWDDHAILEHGDFDCGTLRGRMRHAPETDAITFTITGISGVVLAAHPWSERALHLTGDMHFTNRIPRPPVLGIERAPRSFSRRCREIWLVRPDG